MKVHSMVYPQDREYIRNKVLVNFNVEEITDKDGTVSYQYEQLRLEPYTDEETINLMVAKRKEELKPKVLTPRQARLILLQYELLDDIEEIETEQELLKDKIPFEVKYKNNFMEVLRHDGNIKYCVDCTNYYK